MVAVNVDSGGHTDDVGGTIATVVAVNVDSGGHTDDVDGTIALW